MNKKGQALVEFVIILPILIMVIFAIIDFGNIIYNKISLENKLNDVILMLENNEKEDKINEYLNKNNTKITYKVILDKTKTVKLFTSVNIITPGLNKVLKSPHKIEVLRVIYEI